VSNAEANEQLFEKWFAEFREKLATHIEQEVGGQIREWLSWDDCGGACEETLERCVRLVREWEPAETADAADSVHAS
jgi:hypothetical protein